MEIPKISIIVPVYNSENYLNKCLDSIIFQTFINFECILVNDCSTDNSQKICEDYLKLDPRFKLINKEQNEGCPLARKTGLESSKGDYIQFIDSDDWLESNMLELIYNKAISNDYDMIIFGCYIYNINGLKSIKKQYFINNNKEKIIKDILDNRIKPYIVTKLIKRNIILKIDFPIYNCNEDSVITIQSIFYSKNIGYIDLPLYHYRYNENSLVRNPKKNVLNCIEENKNWHKIIDFLNQKYINNLELFKPELDNKINRLKKKYLFNNKLRFNKNLYKLYPDSNFIFWCFKKSIKWSIKIINKTI